MMDYLLGFAQCFLNYFVIYVFMLGIYPKRFNKFIYDLTVLGIAAAALAYINFFKNPAVNTITTLILTFSWLLIVFKTSFLKAGFVTAILTSIGVGCEFISIGILSFVTKSNIYESTNLVLQSVSLSFISTGISFVLILSVKFILLKLKRIVLKAEHQFNYLLVLLPIFSIWVAYYIVETSFLINLNMSMSLQSFGIILCLIAINVIVFASDYDSRKKHVMSKQLTEMNAQSNMKIALINEQDKNIKEKNIIIHEFKHQLIMLQALVKSVTTTEEKKQFLKNVTDIMSQLPKHDIFMDIQNNALRCIFISTYSDCIKHNISFDAVIRYSDFIFLSDIDICTIFSNAFENALTACIERRAQNLTAAISINIQRSNDIVSVFMTNDKITKVIERDGVFETTKQDKASHGIGLTNIKRTIEKVGGTMDISYTDETFTVKLLFML
ncbi:MAG: GHKL domain-containing protein [Oscillospiraceae bacterium]